MRTQVARLPEKDRKQAQMARPMKEVVSGKTTPFKFGTLDAKTREAAVGHARNVHAYTDKRSQWESTSAAPKAGPEPKVVVTPKEPARTPVTELPKEPVKTVTPPDQPRTLDRGVVVGEPPAGQDVVTPHKVTITKSPVGAREPVRDKDLAPPPKPEHPKADLDAKPKSSKDDALDRSKLPDEPPDKPDRLRR
jgi:hypothetical protein